MDLEKEKKSTRAENAGNYGYGGGYAGYNAGAAGGYGYGYGGDSQENSAQRTIQDYILILRERAWYIVVVFLVVFSSALVYTLSAPKIYQSVSSVQIFRTGPRVLNNVTEVVDADVRTAEDLNTQVKVLESERIIQKVAERLQGADLAQFLAPYEKADSDTKPDLLKILRTNRKIVPQRLSLLIVVQYEHQDPEVAAKIANLFIDEYISYNAKVRVDESMKAVEELQMRADAQSKKVAEMGVNLQRYREKNNLISLDQRKDIVTEKLKTLNQNVTQTSARLNEAETRWKQVKQVLEANGDLLSLSFFSTNNQTLIGDLSKKLADLKIVHAQMKERYRPQHPKMIELNNSLEQTQREFDKALKQAAAAIEGEYQAALRIDQEAKAALAKQQTESLELDRYAVDYTNLERELKIAEQQLAALLARMSETRMSSTIETQNARVVDRAMKAKKPISPNIPLNLGLGLLGGLGLGLAFAFFVAYIDDRVKSSYDIEAVIGLPLIGIIPEIKKMEQPDRAQIVMNNADRQVAEAFLTLHSSLRLKDESKNACVILTTSTIPGEGKSFMSTNLALTFAAHGEKVIVVDCDLRKPNIHKSFRLENLKGLIDVVTGKETLDNVIIKNVHPNFDVLPTGGRAKNPTHILNSKNFEQMISDLKKRYDRVFVDTPPLAAVSDAMIVLPLCDGSIFTIFFNKVRRKAAQFAAQKLTDANVPNFGAVLNGLNLAVSGYYYAQYYDKTYKDYYVVMAKQDPETVER